MKTPPVVACVLVAFLLLVPARAQSPRPVSTPSADSGSAIAAETSRLRAQLHVANVEIVQLRAAVARLQAEADLLRLSAERQSLEAILRQEQKPPAGAVFNWQTLTFDSPKEPKE